jgi:hypothetical protein
MFSGKQQRIARRIRAAALSTAIGNGPERFAGRKGFPLVTCMPSGKRDAKPA